MYIIRRSLILNIKRLLGNKLLLLGTGKKYLYVFFFFKEETLTDATNRLRPLSRDGVIVLWVCAHTSVAGLSPLVHSGIRGA